MTVLNNIGSGFNRTAINDNFDVIEDELSNKVLKRVLADGEDNSMQADIDMNNKKILNLPFPVGPTEPVRLIDLSTDIPNLGIRQLTVSTLPPTGIPNDNEEWIQIGTVLDGVVAGSPSEIV
tara:strand:- start:14248 stop:14613 length:366 start_codon:yes stop_codon:yes gene_type:complete